jgi:hypothetical protein
LNFDQELRIRANFTRISLLYTNLGATYKINKWIRVAGAYRFIAKYKDDILGDYVIACMAILF